jgi:predicted phage terminase large subunit-like protein
MTKPPAKRYKQEDVDKAKAEHALTGKEETVLARRLAALKSQTSLLAYTKYTMPDPEAPNDVTKSLYDAQPFHEAVADALERVEKGEIQQLIFCMPPRHGKTELATKHMAAWMHGKHPEWDGIVATYSDEKAWEFGGDTRSILQSAQHKQVFPDYALRRGSTAKDFMQSQRGGKLLFKGRGGALTGSGMHFGLGDDLFKDDKEAASQAIRDQAWNWFVKVFMTRRMGPKLVILTMTRWHSDDIIGRLTDTENEHYRELVAKRWRIIRFPAIAEDDDVLGRKKGEALWPVDGKGAVKYDLEFLEEQQAMDPLGFEALYQQNPTVADGVTFRRENMRYYRTVGDPGGGVVLLPKELRLYGCSDHAVKTNQRNDPSCLIKVGVDQFGNIYILDALWGKIKTDAAVEALIDMGQDAILWWAGRDHITQSIGPFLYKRMEERKQWINIREVPAIGDKEQRAQPMSGLVARQKLFFPRDAGWTEKAINELLAFPNGNHDDFVDALACLGLGLRSQINAAPPQATKEAPKFGTLAWVKYADKWDDSERRRTLGRGF